MHHRLSKQLLRRKSTVEMLEKRANALSNQRFVQRNGRINIERRGLQHSSWQDLYHRLLSMAWPAFLGWLFAGYIATNLVFALAYLLEKDSVANATSLLDTFFFSVQTMATIGYGVMAPKTPYANLLVVIEALFGLLGVAMATGLMFARFSRPTARVLFSRVAVIAPYNGVPTLMFRAANQRGNQILEARLWVTLARDELTQEGHYLRRLHDLKLVRQHSPFFELTWTAMHPIDEDSPFYGKTQEFLAQSQAEIIVTLTGTDGTFAQTVHARHSFVVGEILWNMRFVDIFSKLPNGRRVLDYTHFHEVIPL